MVMTSWQVTIVKWIKILRLKLLAFLCSKLWKGVRPRFQMWQGTNWLLSGKTNIPFHAPEKWGINFVSTLCKLIHFYPLEKHLIVLEPEKRYQCPFYYFRKLFFPRIQWNRENERWRNFDMSHSHQMKQRSIVQSLPHARQSSKSSS